MGHGEEDCRSTPPRQTGPVNASPIHDNAVHTPDDACLTTMPSGSGHTIPASGTTAKEACGAGSRC